MFERIVPHPSEKPASVRRQRFTCALTIVAVTAVVYLSSFGGDFIFDDYESILVNGDIHSLSPEAINRTFGITRIVVAYTIAANYWLGGLEIFGYHLVNLAIHLAAALTLFGVTHRVLGHLVSLPLGLGNSMLRSDGNRLRIACAAAVLFAVHPLQTSAVTYVIQRMESLASLFYLLTLYALVRAATGRRTFAWGTFSVAAFSLAIFSKEFAITAPAVALLLDRTCLAGTWSAVWRNRRWLYFAYAIPLVVMMYLLAPKLHLFQPKASDVVAVDLSEDAVKARQSAERQLRAADGPMQRLLYDSRQLQLPDLRARRGIGRIEFIRSQPMVILYYFRLAFWPQDLCFDYQWQPESAWSRILPPAVVLLVFVAIASGVMLSPGAATVKHLLMFPVLSGLIVLSPRCTLQILDLAVEYRMYLPLALITPLFSAVVFWAVDQSVVAKHVSVWFTLLMGALGFALAAQTVARNELFHSRTAMWQDVVAKRPENVRAKRALAGCYASDDRTLEALEEIREAVELLQRPLLQQIDPALVYRSYGDRLREAGQIQNARDAYLIAFKLNPAVNAALRGLSAIDPRYRQNDPRRNQTGRR
jgi:tetratricopeptide (TPR) repeat protein